MALVSRIHQECTEDPAVPENLVKAAKSVFPTRRAEAASPEWLSLPLLAARLVFDNMAGLAQAGARAASEHMVQAVYHAGDYAIEVQIEREPESAEMAVVGQVVNRDSSGVVLADVPVLLMARSKVVARTQSNRFGEFCLVCRVQGLKLCMQIEEIGKRVEIPLTRIMEGLQ